MNITRDHLGRKSYCIHMKSCASSSSSSGENAQILRPRHSTFKFPSDLIETISKAKQKVVFITGAGISVSSGIPDFRSKGSGLYNTLDCSAYNIPSAELLFDIEFFSIDPEPFYKFAPNLIPPFKLEQLGVSLPQNDGTSISSSSSGSSSGSSSSSSSDNSFPVSNAHKFIKVMNEKKKLLRNYSQNIDGLELLAGIDPKRLVQVHGTIDTLRCTMCKKRKQLKDCVTDLMNGDVLYCKCKSEGVIKPDITFFGEKLPENFFKTMEKDLLEPPTLVIVMGTSLKVGGSVVEFLRRLCPSVPQVLINKDRVKVPKELHSEGFDLEIIGDCDDIVECISMLLGWGSLATNTQDGHVASSGVGKSMSINNHFHYVADDGAEGIQARVYTLSQPERNHSGTKKASTDPNPHVPDTIEAATKRMKTETKKVVEKTKKSLSPHVFIGTDCGATSTKIGGCYEDGSPISLDVSQFPTDAEQGPKKVISGWVDGVEKFLQMHGLIWRQVLGVGLALPGPYKSNRERRRQAHAQQMKCSENESDISCNRLVSDYMTLGKPVNLPETFEDWNVHNEYSLALDKAAGRCIFLAVGNDGSIAGVGEAQRFLASRSLSQALCSSGGKEAVSKNMKTTILFLAPGTGLGASYVDSRGLHLEGDTMNGMEVGHMPAPLHLLGNIRPFSCGCGRNWGCIEAYTSMSGLPQLLAEFLPEYPDHPFHLDRNAEVDPISLKEKCYALRSLAVEGDQLALAIFDFQAKALGLQAASLVTALDSEYVIIGGGLMDPQNTSKQFRDRYIEVLKENMLPYIWPEQRDKIKVESAKLGELSQSIGAAYMAMHLMEEARRMPNSFG